MKRTLSTKLRAVAAAILSLGINAVEACQAVARTAASFGPNAVLAERLEVAGWYQVEYFEPIPAQRARFLQLREGLEAWTWANGGVEPDDAQFLAYKAELAAIPQSLVWRAYIPNVVTTVGKNYLLDNGLAGSGYTAAFYLGLISSSGFTAVAAADTMASHAGWTESTAYSNSTRVAVSWNAASAGSKASTTCVYNINATDTIKGAFLTTGSAKGGTSGTLYSAGLFSGGDQPVTSGGTLNVTYTGSL